MAASPEVCRMNGAKSKGPRTERGRAIASRNATKHGLLAQKPPLLAGEDLATFQGLLQSLVDEYEPQGAIEWHLVQAIAMGIQRQHRLWEAEAALGNAQLMPPVRPPSTNQRYPASRPAEVNDTWSQYHPTNLATEKRLLRWYLDRHVLEDYPAYGSKYFADAWQDWQGVTCADLKQLQNEYPIKGIPGNPDTGFTIAARGTYHERSQAWLEGLKQENHPYAEAYCYFRGLHLALPPGSRRCWKDGRDSYRLLLDHFGQRLEQIEQIEQEIRQEGDRYQRDLAEYRAQTTSAISEQVLLLSRYESHIAKQLKEAIAQLRSLQHQRKTKDPMGSFG